MNPHDFAALGAADIVTRVRAGDVSAREAAECALARIDAIGARYNAFTLVMRERALAEADAIDRMRAQRRALPTLAGVPYAGKNLFDIEGVTTLAGARIEASRPPASSKPSSPP